jgi:RNA polymerase sigma factor (sigma-70 family)
MAEGDKIPERDAADRTNELPSNRVAGPEQMNAQDVGLPVAEERMYAEFRLIAVGYAIKHTGNEAKGEELGQLAVEEFFEQRLRKPGFVPDNLGGYACKLVQRLTVKRHLSEKRADARGMKYFTETERVSREWMKPDAGLETPSKEPLLQLALKQLPKRLGEVVIQAKVLGRSYKEIAAEFGIKETSVQVQVCRAMAKLREILKTDPRASSPKREI